MGIGFTPGAGASPVLLAATCPAGLFGCTSIVSIVNYGYISISADFDILYSLLTLDIELIQLIGHGKS